MLISTMFIDDDDERWRKFERRGDVYRGWVWSYEINMFGHREVETLEDERVMIEVLSLEVGL